MTRTRIKGSAAAVVAAFAVGATAIGTAAAYPKPDPRPMLKDPGA
jgi:hypothetical protein